MGTLYLQSDYIPIAFLRIFLRTWTHDMIQKREAFNQCWLGAEILNNQSLSPFCFDF